MMEDLYEKVYVIEEEVLEIDDPWFLLDYFFGDDKKKDIDALTCDA